MNRIVVLVLSVFLCFSNMSYADNGDFTVSGNVGVGTPAPSQKLDVNGNINSSGNLTVTGNVGVGKATSTYNVDVNGTVNATQLCIAGNCQSSWPSRFGGFYMTYGASCYVANPQTGGCSCPGGYSGLGWAQGTAGFLMFACQK